ncbi:effector binding domain-containing protein [Cohnella silvisoli]|uniref:Effector binding domain-containing protein n=1 Tax=Cohnella silvisoli TaxID=2873699 RepID=A0ABV1KW02_9BACL|nr:effector binding domain-containing protein [Cohnella silvisoli]MCD9023620.1 effector binding domain-containing protein [Cohnella silvisoli]
MKVTIVEKQSMKMAVIKSVRNGSDVRQAWKRVQQLLKGHPAVGNDEYGHVLIPEWQWPTEVTTLWTGVEVNSFDNLPEGLETITIPARRFARITVKGNRERMNETYAYLGEWFGTEGYERDMNEGSYGYEANRLMPINPFDIPANEIDEFDFDIYAPIKESQSVQSDRFPAILKVEVQADKARKIVGMEAFIQQSTTPPNLVIGPLWHQLMQRFEEISDRSDNPHHYGLLSYKPPFGSGQDFTYLAGFEVGGDAPLPDGFVTRTIPARLVAIVTYQGLAKNITQAWEFFHGSWLSQSGYEAIHDFDYEVYDHRFHGVDSTESIMEVHFPIQLKQTSNLLTDKMMYDEKGGFELQDMRDAKVHMACFKGAEFHGIDLRNASLEHVNFVDSKWQHIFFSNVHVNMAQLGGTVFENIKRPDAAESRFTEEAGTDGWINVEPVTFRNSDLSTAIFENCDLVDVDIRNCRTEGMRINGILVQDLLTHYKPGRE